MSLELYTNALVLVNGSLLTEEQHIRMNRVSGSQPQETVAKGYAGESPGAAKLTMQITNAVPSKDFELNPGQFIKKLTVVEVTIFAAGRSLTTKGFLISDDFDHGTASEAKLDFSFRGEYADWV